MTAPLDDGLDEAAELRAEARALEMRARKLESAALVTALEAHGGNEVHAARSLGWTIGKLKGLLRHRYPEAQKRAAELRAAAKR